MIVDAHMTTPEGKAFGPHHAHAKLTQDQVDEVRRLRREKGLPYRTIGQMFGIDHKTARSIAIGRTWKPVTGRVVFRASQVELEQVRAMVAQGVGVAKIACTLGATERSVSSLMKRHGLCSINPAPGHKAECKHGHAMNGDNLIVANGKHVCRECNRRNAREYARKKRKEGTS